MWMYRAGVELFLGSKVLRALFGNLHSSLFSLSPLWSANYKTKHALNVWPKKYLQPCSFSPKSKPSISLEPLPIYSTPVSTRSLPPPPPSPLRTPACPASSWRTSCRRTTASAATPTRPPTTSRSISRGAARGRGRHRSGGIQITISSCEVHPFNGCFP